MPDDVMDFLMQHEDHVIQKWIEGMEKEYPGVYHADELKNQCLLYYHMIIDIHISINSHLIFELIAEWCKIVAEKKVPMVHILHCSHIFRSALIETISTFDENYIVSLKIISMISSRIDTFERMVCSCYWDYAEMLLDEQEKILNDVHEDKINIIGKMAASMAHEIRNPLTSIGGFIKLLRSHLPQNSLEKVENYIQIIESEFENIQMQITGFLSFSKKRVIEEPFVTISVEQLIDTTLLLINPRLINENIDFTVDLQKDKILYVQKVSLQQVLSNILNNGIDALRAINGSRKLIIHDQEDTNEYYLMITNNGPEIPKHIKKTLFTPFVTSKTDGTGLGLAICKQIMKKNNGDISFRTSNNETSFILKFDTRHSNSLAFND